MIDENARCLAETWKTLRASEPSYYVPPEIEVPFIVRYYYDHGLRGCYASAPYGQGLDHEVARAAFALGNALRERAARAAAEAIVAALVEIAASGGHAMIQQPTPFGEIRIACSTCSTNWWTRLEAVSWEFFRERTGRCRG